MKHKIPSRGDRCEPTDSQKADVRAFYGDSCVACGESEEMTVYHHVNEIHDKRNTVFENLVPLCSGCNDAIEWSKPTVKKRARSDRADPELIQPRAKWLFVKGKFPASYACYRIAAHLFLKRQKNRSRQLECLAYSIGSLRPSGEPRLVRYTLLSEVKRAFDEAGTGAPPRWRAECASQIGLLLYDFGKFKVAHECLERASKMLEKYCTGVSLYVPYVEDHEQLFATEARRLCFVMAAPLLSDPSRYQKLKDDVLKRLADGMQVFLKYYNFRGYATNIDVMAQLEKNLRGGPREDVLQMIKEVLQYQNRIENDWVQASLYAHLGLHHEAEYRKSKSKKAKALAVKWLMAACRKFSQGMICPEPSMNGGGLPLDEMLKGLGCTDVPVVGHRTTSPLSNRELRDVMNSVIGH
jgi:tetratricopeptide (TPR) repeat protein